MSSSPLRSKSGYHACSISLPPRPHPLIPQGDEHLCRLRAFGPTSSSLSSVAERLSVLEGLYECLDDSLVLPHTQQVFSQQRQEKWVEDALDGFLRLLDFCAIAKDISTQTKQDLQGLLLTLRRRRDGRTKVKSRLNGFSLVLSKSKDEETNTNEFEKVDVVLNALKGHKTSRFDGTIQVEEVQNLLQKTELAFKILNKD
ncbi:hypothetical protein RHMOL_Rhmol11G0282000 [Rhododendron molle]|uniref:Uncharacterized protein n=1 Tax=Rhododendron molle TaxID=49168 RepID=A0ACC0LY07_RHOML|nr:hypothetical protein RHMOL_Rhmol11G0282000 [Rhododendron molle]